MRYVLIMLLVLVGVLAPLPVRAKPVAKKPAAVVGELVAGQGGNYRLILIAAFNGRRWVDSEKATGLLHKGDRLAIFQPATGLRGEAALTDAGHLGSQKEDVGEGESYGLEFKASASLGAGAGPHPEEKGPLLATWSEDGAAPHWLKMTELPKPAKGSAYWRVAREWLRAGLVLAGRQDDEHRAGSAGRRQRRRQAGAVSVSLRR